MALLVLLAGVSSNLQLKYKVWYPQHGIIRSIYQTSTIYYYVSYRCKYRTITRNGRTEFRCLPNSLRFTTDINWTSESRVGHIVHLFTKVCPGNKTRRTLPDQRNRKNKVRTFFYYYRNKISRRLYAALVF